ncbi:MAG: hypothetical protein FWG81_04880 [Betaproteobacteria bacterium]|nr:hypothetical protein [Betaproteobacteria bacterium]
MRGNAVFVGALCFWLAAAPAGAEETSPWVHGRWYSTHDTDKFDETRILAGYRFANGLGFDALAMHYHAPGWSANGQGLRAAYTRKTVEREIDVSFGVHNVRGHQLFAGSLDYLERLTPDSALGVSLERDIVNSVQGIDKGLSSTALMLVAEHQFTPRFGVGIAAGSTRFSDGNYRPILRARWNYELAPEYGVSAYLKNRYYENTRPYLGNYYAPESLHELSLGLAWRTALSDYVVFTAEADGGQQWVDRTDRRAIWSTRLALQSPRRAQIQWKIALEVSNNAGSQFDSDSVHYRYYSLGAYLLIPLR